MTQCAKSFLKARSRPGLPALGLVGATFFALALVGGCRQKEFLYYSKDGSALRSVKFSIDRPFTEKIDVLWAIDNSGSMVSYIPDLDENVSLFMDELDRKGVDWRMGMVSLDPDQSPYLGLLSKRRFERGSANPARTFRNALAALSQTKGSDKELGFDPVIQVLSDDTGFLRPDALLAVVFMTDAPEQSQATGSTQFLNQLRRLKGRGSYVVAHGAFAPTDFGCLPTDDAWSYAQSAYEGVVGSTGGIAVSLCTGDFGKELARMAREVRGQQKPVISLPDRPVPGSIRVRAGEKRLTGGSEEQGGLWLYRYDWNAVVIHGTESLGHGVREVVVEYEKAAGSAEGPYQQP